MNFRGTERREVEVENVTRFCEYFICSACGKTFRDAVKVRDVSTTFGKTYLGCPRCLAKVSVQDDASRSPALTPSARPRPSFECQHYENLKMRLIPDECLVCPELIECTKRHK